MQNNLKVVSVGGSIIAPSGPDPIFIKNFCNALKGYLDEDKSRRLILVCGGGATARIYQKAYRDSCENPEDSEADWIGIMSTRLNGTLVRAVLRDYCLDSLVTDPTGKIDFTGRVLVASGWKPGFSTDTDAVLLAKRFGGKVVINLSNIKKVYTSDPRTNPDAKPLDRIGWDEFCKMVGTKWQPGKSVPFDPVASAKAREAGLKVVCADGHDIENALNILCGRPYVGTLIG